MSVGSLAREYHPSSFVVKHRSLETRALTLSLLSLLFSYVESLETAKEKAAKAAAEAKIIEPAEKAKAEPETAHKAPAPATAKAVAR